MAKNYTRYDRNDPRIQGRSMSPEVLAALRAGQAVPGWTTALDRNTANFGEGGTYDDPNRALSQDPLAYTYDDPSRDWFQTYDPSGSLMNEGSDDNSMTAKDWLTYLAAVATAGGASALTGSGSFSLGGAAPGMGGEFGGAAGEILGADVAGYTPGMGLTGGGAAVGGAGAATGGGLTGGGLTGGGGLLGAGSSVGGLLKDAAPILGAVAGAVDSRDQEATSKSEPWGPAQDWIKQNIAQGQQLQQQYTAQPFSQAQQTGYGNLAGLLNFANQNAPSLLAGFSANAEGRNQFDRSSPTRGRGLMGSAPTNANWNPGLLNYFPRG
jgi:hypothetical protein